MTIGDRPPTSPYGIIRRAQEATDAGMQKLIDGVTAGAPSGSAPPDAPVQVAPKPGSTIGVVA
jgi:hypothetical protein